MNNTKSALGKKGRASGKRFEIRVRKDLEDKGFIICKWTNTVDFEKNKLVSAKSKYNPFLKRVMSEGSGWPDFLAYTSDGDIIGVESKKAKYLDAKEKKIAQWLLDNKIFPAIYVAYPEKRKISYNKLGVQELSAVDFIINK